MGENTEKKIKLKSVELGFREKGSLLKCEWKIKTWQKVGSLI